MEAEVWREKENLRLKRLVADHALGIQILKVVMACRGNNPESVGSDNGPALVARALRQWVEKRGVKKLLN